MKRLCILFLVTWGFLFCFPNTLYARQTAAVVNGNDTAATAEEFEAWLHAHKTTGGTLTLTQDIYIDHDFDYLSGTMIRYLQPVTIDTGAHTIYVKGFLLMEALNYKLTIRGEGNEQGLIHVLPGGNADIGMVNIEAACGFALIQEEGSVLGCISKELNPVYGNRIQGEVRFAQKPVIDASNITLPDVVLSEQQTLHEDMLQSYVNSLSLYYQGKSYNVEYADIVWDVDEYPHPKPYTFYTYHGRYAGKLDIKGVPASDFHDVYVLTPPSVRVITTDGGVALLGMRKSYSYNYEAEMAEFSVYSAQRPKSVAIGWRTAPTDSWQITPVLQDESWLDEGKFLVYLLDKKEYVEFYAEVVLDQGVYATNVISWEKNKLVFQDIEGGRGGGVELLPQKPPQPEPDQNDSVSNTVPEQEPSSGSNSEQQPSKEQLPAGQENTDQIELPFQLPEQNEAGMGSLAGIHTDHVEKSDFNSVSFIKPHFIINQDLRSANIQHPPMLSKHTENTYLSSQAGQVQRIYPEKSEPNIQKASRQKKQKLPVQEQHASIKEKSRSASVQILLGAGAVSMLVLLSYAVLRHFCGSAVNK